jgi:hypothetical protein
MKLKQRKSLFLVLMALTAGSSLAMYNVMEGDFLVKTIQIVVFQQLVGAAIYFSCFGVDLVRSRSPFE